MELNYIAILIAVIAQFAVGFVWYGPLFGKLWGMINGFDKLSKQEQEKMMKEMGPMYGIQLIVTIMTTVVLAIVMNNLPSWSAYSLVSILWMGFTVPAQVSSVLFSNTERQWMLSKVLLLVGGSFVSLQVAAAILSFMMM